MDTIPCLVCDNESIELPDCFDTHRYDGHLVCQDCSTLYHVKLADDKVQLFKIVEKKLRIPSADDIARILRSIKQQSSQS